jgi:hypothetical protein
MYPAMLEVANDVRKEMAVVRDAIRRSRERSSAPSESLIALMRDVGDDVRADMNVVREGIRISRERAALKAAAAQAAALQAGPCRTPDSNLR